MNSLMIRPAIKEDVAELWKMIEELGEYEKMPGKPQNSPAGLERDGFGENPSFKCAVVEESIENLVGYVIYYPIYTPRIGKIMYLQDLYVRENYRGMGLGKRLFMKVVHDAYESECYRIDWRVLLWNNARKMYDKLGGVNITEKCGWQSYELDKAKMKELIVKENCPTI